MSATRRQVIGGFFGVVAASLLAACQTPSSAAPHAATSAGSAPTEVNPLVKPRATGAELTAVQASSELALGRNRFALGLIDVRNQPIVAGNVGVEFFKLLANGTGQKRSEARAQFRSIGGSKGVWVSQVTFPETGPWGARVTLQSDGGTPKVSQLNFDVKAQFSAPGYDQPAIRSQSLTVRDVNGDASHVCSNAPACELHSLSIAEALADGRKPLVVVFATPALCTSATCAPELQAVQQLHASYPEQANFVHVEIYQYPYDGQKVVPAVEEWHLPSEPWTFVVDRSGIVRDRFEGAAPVEELEPSLEALLA